MAYARYQNDPEFLAEFHYELKHFVGRPSPIYHAARTSREMGGAQIYLKREDLNHTGAHKINNVIGQAMLAKRMGKPRVIAGLWAEKFDQMAAFQNFIIMPMTFLSGVFYSIHSLPPFWQKLSHLNPFFYMIDGFRYGFFGQSDVSPWLSLAVQLQAIIAAGLDCTHLTVEGDGRHWSAVVVSDAFVGLRPIARHQRVYATLGQKMHTDEVHALSMKTFTSAEWAAQNN
eukprot:gene30621-37865_t